MARAREGRTAADDASRPRFRLDDLRHLAAALGAGVGLAPSRAAALATHLLWFDAAGAASFGIATLPDWLERIAARQVDPRAEGTIGLERAGTANLDGQNGVGPLILARAASLAAEKARDVGVGLVRVTGLGPTGPAAPAAAEIAIGPEAAALIGPGPVSDTHHRAHQP
ncbi:MAG: Ldh family oxidoreductase, partial [Isosphaeraceae bacterium]|nr:Ldh family oxidoreductase [Isosphaeraceae bacterium]